MELSSKDIKRLEETGYRREEFAVMDERPLGCHLYPVVYLVNEGAIVDEMSNGTDDFRTRIENKRKNP